MQTSKKILIPLFLILPFFIFSKESNASEYDNSFIQELNRYIPSPTLDPSLDTNINEENLNIKKEKYLPIDSVYFLKEWLRSIELSTTINNYKKIELEGKISSKYIFEIKKCKEINNDKCISISENKYKKSKDYLYQNISKLNESEKIKILNQLIELEFNHYTILKQLNTPNAKIAIQNNTSNLSSFIKDIKDKVELKTSFKNLNKITNKTEFVNILINDFLSKISYYSNIENKSLIDQIINENYISTIQKINNLPINTLENDLVYYLYKISDTNEFIKNIKLIDNLYTLQKQVEDSKNKEDVKISILNAKQLFVSLLNINLENINKSNFQIEINKILLDSNDTEKLNALVTIAKRSNERTEINQKIELIINGLYRNIEDKIINIKDDNQKEKEITNIFNKISPENIEIVTTIKDYIKAKTPTNNVLFIKYIESILSKIEVIKDEKLCINEYNPVCGVNGQTYINKCFANKVLAEIKYKGECNIEINESLEKLSPKDISNGYYYGDKKTKRPGTPTEWILMDSKTDKSKWIDPEKIIKLKPILNQESKISEETILCSSINDPVCGIDNITYSNSCFADAKNIKIKYTGSCK